MLNAFTRLNKIHSLIPAKLCECPFGEEFKHQYVIKTIPFLNIKKQIERKPKTFLPIFQFRRQRIIQLVVIDTAQPWDFIIIRTAQRCTSKGLNCCKLIDSFCNDFCKVFMFCFLRQFFERHWDKPLMQCLDRKLFFGSTAVQVQYSFGREREQNWRAVRILN